MSLGTLQRRNGDGRRALAAITPHHQLTMPAHTVQNQAISVQPVVSIDPALVRYVCEAAQLFSTPQADTETLWKLLSSRQEPTWTRYWWEAWMLGVAGETALISLVREFEPMKFLDPRAYRMLMESQWMGDPAAVAAYSRQVIGVSAGADPQPEPGIADGDIVSSTSQAEVAPEPVLPAAPPAEKKRRSLSAYKG